MPLKRRLAAAALAVLACACGGDDVTGRDAGSPDAGDVDAGPPPTVVPAELADDDALAVLSAWASLPTFGDGAYRQQSSTDRLVGEPAPTPLLENGNRDMNHFVCASEDAEIEEPSLVPFLFDRARCPEHWVRGVVLARFEGSGRMTRIWLTALSLREAPADREVLRIYVDDAREPVVQVPLAQALDGSAGEIFAPPFGAGSTHRLAWYYPVVFGSRLVVTLDRLGPLDLYYSQVDVVLDDTPRERSAPSSRLDARDAAAALLSGAAPMPGEAVRADVALVPGERATMLDRAGAGTIRALRVEAASDAFATLESATLAAYWDGSATAAIELPLTDLFGAAMDPPDGNALVLGGGVEAGVRWAELRLPMPFEDGARIDLVNGGGAEVALSIALTVDTDVPPAPFGRLTAVRMESGPGDGAPHPIASIDGGGRLVGVCLALAGHALEGDGLFVDPYNFLEGDEVGQIDGVPIAGTGTEDYLNGAFYFAEGPLAEPFAQVWGIAAGDPEGHGRASGCRWHVLGDAIDFDTELDLALEIGPGDPTLRDRYVSVAWLYR